MPAGCFHNMPTNLVLEVCTRPANCILAYSCFRRRNGISACRY